MRQRDAFERVVATLHEAVLDPSVLERAFVLIEQSIGVHGTTTALGQGESSDDVQIHSLRCYVGGQRRPDMERDYLEDYYPWDEKISRCRQLPDSKVVHVTDLYTEEELKSSRTYNEALVRNRSQDSLNVRLDGPDGTRVLWVANDPVDRHGWSTARVKLIRDLLPHIRHSVCTQLALASAGALTSTLVELLDATGLGVIQFDARGRIFAANDRARSLLEAGDPLFDSQGFLFARSIGDNANLQALLTRALPPLGGMGVGGAAAIQRAKGLPPLVLHVHPVRTSDADPAWPVAALMVVVDAATGTPIDPTVVAEVLDLTGMESLVAVLLAEGKRVSAIAAATDRKQSTIRHHVKSIFVKHGLSRQAELVRLVRSLAGARQPRQ